MVKIEGYAFVGHNVDKRERPLQSIIDYKANRAEIDVSIFNSVRDLGRSLTGSVFPETIVYEWNQTPINVRPSHSGDELFMEEMLDYEFKEVPCVAYFQPIDGGHEANGHYKNLVDLGVVMMEHDVLFKNGIAQVVPFNRYVAQAFKNCQAHV